jgi:hypothetical protein
MLSAATPTNALIGVLAPATIIANLPMSVGVWRALEIEKQMVRARLRREHALKLLAALAVVPGPEFSL